MSDRRSLETRETLYRRHHALLDAAASAFFTRYTTRPSRRTLRRVSEKAGRGRTLEVAAQSLACEIIVGGDMSCGTGSTGEHKSELRSAAIVQFARSRSQ